MTKYQEDLLEGEVDWAPGYVVLYFGLLAWQNVTTGNVWYRKVAYLMMVGSKERGEGLETKCNLLSHPK